MDSPVQEPHPADGESHTSNDVLVFDGDLFFVVKIADTLKRAGYTVRTARRLDVYTRMLVEHVPAVVLINLALPHDDWHAAIQAARGADVPIIAYGPHVDIETHHQARRAGATTVIANSRLAGDLAGIVARTLHRHTSGHSADAADDAFA